ncbi:NACHT domain-containing protein [Rhodopseudomonas telluris]|uniref:NACHT domain-containing protein n=1 Tax=Rhodopseudomonas telluris TaxID=644215 RepID=A0ABV6EXX7_9BRAD
MSIRQSEYIATVQRLTKLLGELDSNKSRPLADVANTYRKATEAICKAIVLGATREPGEQLVKLVSDAKQVVEFREGPGEAKIFRLHADFLRDVGNLFSHDGPASSVQVTRERLDEHLVALIRIGFFGESDLDPPELPDSFRHLLSERTLKKHEFEEIRSEVVVRLCFPRQEVVPLLSRKESASRLFYDYVTVDLGGGLSRGFLFLRSRSAIERCLVDLLNELGNRPPDSLSIVTPRVYRNTGDAVDRKKSIGDIIESLRNPWLLKRQPDVVYFDEFVWKNCLPDAVRKIQTMQSEVPSFIPQTLEPQLQISVGDRNISSIDSINYTRLVLDEAHKCNPVQVVTGPAGIGKTTFCDHVHSFVNSNRQKKVIFISATDFRDIATHDPVTSVSDLYKLAVTNSSIGDEASVEIQNFEINLSCGNFVLIIDGFDELESHLGGSLIFDRFMESLQELEDCFHRVFVILTVRDYAIERFERLNYVSVLRLRGFTKNDTDRYFSNRLGSQDISTAQRLLAEFRTTKADKGEAITIPLYASLICDYLSEDPATEKISEYSGSSYFEFGGPLDVLVKKIVDREIVKQSLGAIKSDDFFEIMIDIIRSPQMSITTELLSDYVLLCGRLDGGLSSNKLHSNPFLQYTDGAVKFKYDSLANFFKSRLLYRRIRDGVFSVGPPLEFMADLYRGQGPLFEELLKVLPPKIYSRLPSARRWFGDLRRLAEGDAASGVNFRRAISGFIHWTTFDDQTKSDRRETLTYLFSGNIWEKFTIFERFSPLDLEGVIIYDGYLENYSNIVNCEFGSAKKVFHRSWIDFKESAIPEKMDKEIFAADCSFGPLLQSSFEAKDVADETELDVIRDNLMKVLKVGFRGNAFVWKSAGLYKNAVVHGKHSLNDYIDLLLDNKVLIEEPSRSDHGTGYRVSNSWYLDAKKLIEDRNLTSKMKKIVNVLR